MHRAHALLVGSGDVQLFLKMASRDPSRVITHLMDMLRENPHGEESRSGILGSVDNTASAREHDLKADLSDADKYFACFTGVLEFAISPRDRCPQYAASHGVRNRTLAWQ